MKTMFLPRWENTQSYLKEMTGKFNKETLSFKPTEEVMTAQEQLAHLCRHMNWVYGMLSGESVQKDYSSVNSVEAFHENQQEVMVRIEKWVKRASESELRKTVFFQPADRKYSKNELLLLLLDHTRDHTGQLVVYLRLNGEEPPKYKGW